MPLPKTDRKVFSPFTEMMKARAANLADAGKKSGVSFRDVTEKLKEYRKRVCTINEGGD